MSAANVELVQGLYAAFMSGDAATLERSFHPDVTWRESGHDWHAGTYSGRDQVLQHLFEGDPVVNDNQLEVVDILASQTRVAVCLRTSGTRSGVHMVNEAVQLIEIRDGAVVDVANYTWDQKGVAEFLDLPL